MALGTAITVAVLATLAIGSRELALKLGGANSTWANMVWATCAIGGATHPTVRASDVHGLVGSHTAVLEGVEIGARLRAAAYHAAASLPGFSVRPALGYCS